MKRKLRFGFTSMFCMLIATCIVLNMTTAQADTIWTGATSQDWTTASNWDNGLPGTGNNDAIVNTATGNYPILSAGTGTSSRDIRVGAGPNGRLDQTGGTLNTGEGSWYFLGYLASNATYNLANTAASGGTYTGFGQGTGSLNVGGSLQSGNLLVGLDNGTVSTVNMNTTGTLAAGGIFLGAAGGSSGNFNIDSGTVTVTGEFQVGASFFSQGSSTNAFKMSGGTVTTNIFSLARGSNNAATMTGTATITGGTLNTLRWFTLGFAGSATDSATVTNSGGTINVNTIAGGTGVLEMGVFDPTQNVFNQNSGVLTLQNNASIAYGQGGNHSGTSTFNQNGGTVTFYSDSGTTVGGTGSINLGNGGSTGTYAYNLNGGTLTVPAIQKVSAGASGSFNFNGGTLKATASNANFMQGLTAANVRNGGAIVDTNGVDITIAQTLQHSSIGGDNATDGGLTKVGAGTLTLAGINTYTGDSVVNAGTLALADNAGLAFVIGASGVNNKITGSGVANLDGDFTFDLTGASTSLGSSWSIVNVGSLTETFGSTFTVNSFVDAGNDTWTKDINGITRYQFSESTGVLQVVPEPVASVMLLSALGMLLPLRRRAA